MRGKMRAWKFRAVQLDLARQMETVEYIKEFTDFIAGWGYNALVLYLEGRIRTKSFPYPSPAESYTPAQMKEVVAYASKRGIEVVPVVSTLGHVEQFLRHPQLAHLAELRGGRQGRFGKSLMVFCPSLPGTREFLEAYLTEVAEIFPSKYFHIGCDEVWEVGYCPLCRERAEGTEGQGGIYGKHLLDSHRILTGKLGKRIIMWDDMFEFYPDALEMLPRDVIMCAWHYDPVVDLPTAHFANREREDAFAKYDRMGFSYLAAPADRTARNVMTLTDYASRHRPLGGLMTTWEKSVQFMYESYPIIALAGRLWSQGHADGAEETHAECIRRLFGVRDPGFVSTVAALDTTGFAHDRCTPEWFLCGPVTDLEYGEARTMELIAAALEPYRSRIKQGTARRVMEDLLVYIERSRLQHRMRRVMPTLYDPRTGAAARHAALEELRGGLNTIDKLRSARRSQWERHRNGIEPCNTDGFYQRFKERMAKVAAETEKRGLLNVLFMLPDQFSAQTVALSIRYAGDTAWQKVAQGVFKAPSLVQSFYWHSYPIAAGLTPVAVRIESWGYGGQGFAFVDAVNARGRFAPSALGAVEGDVEKPANILHDDLQWCFIGERNTRRCMLNPGVARAKHVLEVSLAREV